MSGNYHVNITAAAFTTAVTILQLKSAATCSCSILRIVVTQSNSTTSTMQRLQVVRKSAAATVTSFTPIPLSASDTSLSVGGTAATGIGPASAEGTNSAVLLEEAFNILNGFYWIPTPSEQIIVPPSGIVAVWFPAAPAASMTVSARIVWQEFG